MAAHMRSDAVLVRFRSSADVPHVPARLKPGIMAGGEQVWQFIVQATEPPWRGAHRLIRRLQTEHDTT